MVTNNLKRKQSELENGGSVIHKFGKRKEDINKKACYIIREGTLSLIWVKSVRKRYGAGVMLKGKGGGRAGYSKISNRSGR